ncbi:hypothetical protein QBC37DRAFT_410121 [Rhypophila decipiens]|uniref:Protection of telomeres protein 1 n=1 Tax=Rhypophila decipiens TaxID=261697 RepID=A0AAN7BD14_9PEZI|nr:hypothetical protein QBC37DRAFT_410121 [Rhypophila decipiens]
MQRNSSGPSRGGGGVASLPPKFTELRQILDESVTKGTLINVIGMVKDCRLPIKTSGSDYKCALTLFDLSTEDDGEGVTFDIFRPVDLMPDIRGRDIIVVFQVKVQSYRANPLSLISSHNTEIHVFTANKIPRLPRTAEAALVSDKKVKGNKTLLLSEIYRYVSYFYHKIDKDAAPDVEEFQRRANRSLNIKDKFSLLSDVKEGNYYNLIVRVVRSPYNLYDKLTLYVSDYTKNDDLFNVTWEGLSNLPGADSDPYGYTEAKSSPAKKEWVGPYGRRSIQITCWPPHADVIRDEVSVGQWIYLRNVHIKRGHDGNYLEGAMHEELKALVTTKVNVHVMDATDRDNIDPRLKDAIRRLRDYEKSKKKEVKQVMAAQDAGAKRRGEDVSHDDQPKLKKNSKERRKEKRIALEKKEEERRLKEEAQIALNDLITCENQESRPPQSIESIVQQMTISVGADDEVPIPFGCNKFRARVRVVDFYPPSLEDFACSRMITPFEVLSDASDADDDSDSDSDNEQDAIDRGYERVWEWRFALKLQDVNSQETVWVVVDNSEGQCLTSLDACDLTKDEETLTKLRERTFVLWGNLEEVKSTLSKKPSPPSETPSRGPRGRPKLLQLERPPLDSSDNEDNQGNRDKQGNKVSEQAISNKPFDCCIREYAIKNKGEVAADGDEAKKWIRVFGLYGTKIRV